MFFFFFAGFMQSLSHIRIKQSDLPDRRFTDVSPRQKNGDSKRLALLSVPPGRFIDKNDSGLKMNHYLCPAYRLQIAELSRCQNEKMFSQTYKACYILFKQDILKSWGQSSVFWARRGDLTKRNAYQA